MSAPAAPAITAPQTAEEILKGLGSAVKSAASSASSSVSYYASSYATAENGNYTLNVVFYLVLYAFILFLVLVIVHFTIMPVFKFTPGAKGLIGMPSASDDKVYWNKKVQPSILSFAPADPTSEAPSVTDPISQYPFINNFSFSIDLYVRRMTDTTAKSRVILYKTYKNGSQIYPVPTTAVPDPLANGPTATETLETYMSTKASMFMYLTETNDLVTTFFHGPSGTPFSTRQIKNIPLYTPFRVTVVVEDKTFTIYINAQQAFQRTVPLQLALNSKGGINTESQRFFPPPSWADSPTKTVFLQNLHVWPRAISYTEVQKAQPALALEADFNMPVESGSSSCTA